jgi:hypothetical protein
MKMHVNILCFIKMERLVSDGIVKFTVFKIDGLSPDATSNKTDADTFNPTVLPIL